MAHEWRIVNLDLGTSLIQNCFVAQEMSGYLTGIKQTNPHSLRHGDARVLIQVASNSIYGHPSKSEYQTHAMSSDQIHGPAILS